MDTETIKETAAVGAVDALVKDGMKIGLGTGSTARRAVRYIGKLLSEGKLKDIKAVPTSFQTVIECENNNIPLYTLNSPEISGSLDLTIDGADEVDPQNRCIKGGGGALLLEKIIAYSSLAYAIVVSESKIVEGLGMRFSVPVEVVPEARYTVGRSIENLGGEVKLREALAKAGPVITDHGNLLLDVHFRKAVDPVTMEKTINNIPGVVENGFFVWLPKAESKGEFLRPSVFIGMQDGGVQRRD